MKRLSFSLQSLLRFYVLLGILFAVLFLPGGNQFFSIAVFVAMLAACGWKPVTLMKACAAIAGVGVVVSALASLGDFVLEFPLGGYNPINEAWARIFFVFGATLFALFIAAITNVSAGDKGWPEETPPSATRNKIILELGLFGAVMAVAELVGGSVIVLDDQPLRAAIALAGCALACTMLQTREAFHPSRPTIRSAAIIAGGLITTGVDAILRHA